MPRIVACGGAHNARRTHDAPGSSAHVEVFLRSGNHVTSTRKEYRGSCNQTRGCPQRAKRATLRSQALATAVVVRRSKQRYPS